MSESAETPARVGSAPDMARRLDRLEARHEALEGEVRTLATTVGRVEQNQVHAVELNKLRFDALDTGIKALDAGFRDFRKRIEGIIEGSVETAQSRAGRELVTDYQAWRRDVDEDRERQAVLNGQIKLLGRLAWLLASTNILALVAGVYAVIKT